MAIKKPVEIITINNVIIYEDTLYEVMGKPDALIGSNVGRKFNELGISKSPSEPVRESICVGWSDDRQAFDTGFYESSVCYKSEKPDVRKKLAAAAKRKIAKPFAEARGENVDDLLIQSNDDFWVTHSVEIHEGRTFHTSNNAQLFDLFLIIQQKAVVADDDKLFYTGEWEHANFRIVNKRTKQKVRATADSRYVDALTESVSMLKSDRTTLECLLDMCDLGESFVDSVIDQTTIKSLLKEIFKNPTNLDRWERVLEYTKDPKTADIPKFYVELRRLQEAQSGKLVFVNGSFRWDGKILGDTLQNAAKNLFTNKELYATRQLIAEAAHKLAT